MSLDTYDGLIQSLSSWSKRPDLSGLYPDFITLAEKQIDKKLQLRTNELRALTIPSTDDRFLVLPNDFVEMRALRLFDGSTPHDMYYKPPEGLLLKETPGKPFYYTINSRIEFDRKPDKLYTMEMTYYVGLTPLSETNTSNNVLAKYPELYLYGALFQLHSYTMDEAEEQKAYGKFQEFLSAANAQEGRGRYGTNPTMRVKGDVP